MSVRGLAVAAVTTLLFGAGLSTARASQEPEDFGEPTQQMLEQSVISYDPAASIIGYDPADSIVPLASVESEDGQTTITLATDILFTPDSWELPDSAPAAIADLVADIPDGATVLVGGHTDSNVGAVPNQELSQNRAQAVAAQITAARPDLVLEVTGYADTIPAIAEDPEDPSTYAANRRVEIVYQG
ncbi:MAG: OmpA family protein [Beutenbergiaceae bacterium]